MTDQEIKNVLDYVSKLDLYGYLNTENFDNMAYEANYKYASGATKGVLFMDDKDYVIKIPFDTSDDGEALNGADELGGWDYCQTEVSNYEFAKDNGFSSFFAKTEFIGYSDKRPIYIQEKATVFSYAKHSDDYEERDSRISELCESNDCSGFNAFDDGCWLSDVADYFGEDKLVDFLNFLSDSDMDNDLHNGNLGYIDGRPVLIDYSGYWDN